MIQNSNSYISV